MRSASQHLEGDGGASPPPGPANAELGPTKRHALRAKEHRLIDDGREHLERARERLEEEVQELLDEERRLAERLKGSAPATIWSRLSAVDFMNSSMVFSALALLCLFPFLFIVAAETGGDARSAFIRHLGLDRNAARAVNSLMSSGAHAAATLDVVGAAWVILGAFGIASTLQAWYEKVYDQPQEGRRTRHLVAQLVWVIGLVVYLALEDFLNRGVADLGSPLLVYAVFFAIAVAFYWWTQHILLLGRITWGHLFPGALATGVCVTGLAGFSALVFSGQIVSSDRDYGSIGVVTVILSYMIGFGVCLHLGAVVGRVWTERRQRAPAGTAPDNSSVEIQDSLFPMER